MIQEISLLSASGRVLLALVLGGLVGLQREMKDRPAGLRTHALVAVGSATYTILSLYAFPIEGADVSRVAANIVVGIGFIGAGTIIRQGNVVVGLTTAATLWVVAAIGLACAAGQGYLAIIVTTLVLIVLVLLKSVELRVGRKHLFTVKLKTTEQLNPKTILKDVGETETYSETTGDHYYIYEISLATPSGVDINRIRERLSRIGEVLILKWER